MFCPRCLFVDWKKVERVLSWTNFWMPKSVGMFRLEQMFWLHKDFMVFFFFFCWSEKCMVTFPLQQLLWAIVTCCPQYFCWWNNAWSGFFFFLYIYDPMHHVLPSANFLLTKSIVFYLWQSFWCWNALSRCTNFLMTHSMIIFDDWHTFWWRKAVVFYPPTHFKDKMHCFSSSKLFADKIHHGVMSSWTPQRQRCLVMFLEGQPPSSHIVFMDLLKTKRSIVVRVLSKVIFHLYASVLRHCPLDKFVYWCLDFFFFFFNSIAVLGGECRLQACSAMLWSTQLVCYTMTSTSTEKYNTYTPPSFFLLRVCACFLYVITVEICFPSNFLRITDAHQ